MDAILLAKGPEISRTTGMLAEGTEISRLESSFSIGVTDDGSKSSSLKASLENYQIPSLAYMQFYYSQ